MVLSVRVWGCVLHAVLHCMGRHCLCVCEAVLKPGVESVCLQAMLPVLQCLVALLNALQYKETEMRHHVGSTTFKYGAVLYEMCGLCVLGGAVDQSAQQKRHHANVGVCVAQYLL